MLLRVDLRVTLRAGGETSGLFVACADQDARGYLADDFSFERQPTSAGHFAESLGGGNEDAAPV